MDTNYYFCASIIVETMNKDWIEDIKKACRVMQEGGVILYPTDTIWGLGCDATNEEAVRRVYEIKHRADTKAMLVLVDSAVKVDYYVQDVPAVAWDLLEVADKPLTVIYSGARNLAPNSARPSSPPRPTSAGSLRPALSRKSVRISRMPWTMSSKHAATRRPRHAPRPSSSWAAAARSKSYGSDGQGRTLII